MPVNSSYGYAPVGFYDVNREKAKRTRACNRGKRKAKQRAQRRG